MATTNRRRNRVETPGGDETKKTLPPADQLQPIVAQQTPLPADDSFVEEIAEEAQKGKVVTAQHGHQPQVGAEWAGMVLTEHGWAAKG